MEEVNILGVTADSKPVRKTITIQVLRNVVENRRTKVEAQEVLEKAIASTILPLVIRAGVKNKVEHNVALQHFITSCGGRFKTTPHRKRIKTHVDKRLNVVYLNKNKALSEVYVTFRAHTKKVLEGI